MNNRRRREGSGEKKEGRRLIKQRYQEGSLFQIAQLGNRRFLNDGKYGTEKKHQQ